MCVCSRARVFVCTYVRMCLPTFNEGLISRIATRMQASALYAHALHACTSIPSKHGVGNGGGAVAALVCAHVRQLLRDQVGADKQPPHQTRAGEQMPPHSCMSASTSKRRTACTYTCAATLLSLRTDIHSIGAHACASQRIHSCPQRIPRYKLLLEDLIECTPQVREHRRNTLMLARPKSCLDTNAWV